MGPTCAHMKGISELYKCVMSMEKARYVFSSPSMELKPNFSKFALFLRFFEAKQKNAPKIEKIWLTCILNELFLELF